MKPWNYLYIINVMNYSACVFALVTPLSEDENCPELRMRVTKRQERFKKKEKTSVYLRQTQQIKSIEETEGI